MNQQTVDMLTDMKLSAMAAEFTAQLQEPSFRALSFEERFTHGGLLGFVYSWAGVMLGGTVMFLLWRRVVKRFFWKFARRSAKLQKAEQWVSRFDTASLFMLSLLPFTPSSFMHFAFGISDFDEKRYLVTMLLGKGVMVAMMALFGQSLVSAMKNPFYLVLAIAIWAGMYFASKHFCKKHEID